MWIGARFSPSNLDTGVVETQLRQAAVERVVIDDVLGFLALAELVEWGLGNVDHTGVDQWAHVAEEERQQQRANVRAVDVGVGHENDLAVAQLRKIEFLGADAGAEGLDDLEDFLVAEDLVQAGLLDVEDLAADGQDGLGARVAVALGRASSRIPFDNKEFGFLDLAAGAIDELARKAGAGDSGLSRSLAGAAGGFARLGRLRSLVHDAFGLGRVFFKVGTESFIEGRLDERADFAVAELGFGLALELRLGHHDGERRRSGLRECLRRRAWDRSA